MEVPRCKGTHDMMPKDMTLFRHIEQAFIDSCIRWGYKEVRTPTLEYLQLFTSAGTLTPEMLGRVYSFLDWDGWSGERVVLRPDGTIPIARLYGEHLNQESLAKLFYVENLFAFEGTGEESRERWECGAELIGDTGVAGDVEIIMLALEVLNRLCIDDIEVRISHAGLIKELLAQAGSAEALQKLIDGKMDAVNDLKKTNKDLAKKLSLLFNVTGKNRGYLDNLKAIYPALGRTFDQVSTVTDILDGTGCSYKLHLASGLGFEYYTGIVFQLYCGGRKLGGGGRYDELIPLVGDGPVPASGFALYMDNIMALMEPVGKALSDTGATVLIKPASGNATILKSCYDLASKLRDNGYIAEIELCSQDEAGYNWIIRGGKQFNLMQSSNGKEYKGLSASDVLRRMEAER